MKKQLLFLALCGILTNANAQNDPSATVGDTGTVTFIYQGASVTYTTVRGADGMIWLQQNLGAGQVATSASDPLAYGHYFQWGRWDDGHQPSTSPTAAATTITPNDPSGIPAGNPNFLTGNNPADWWSGGGSNDTWTANPPSSTNGNDPCSAISPGWHVPSQAEFANVVTVEGITNVVTAFSSNLMLTAAGQREPINGSLQNVGTYGQYWTGSPSSLYAKAVSIQPSAVNPSDDAYRSYGSTLRCMTSCTGVFAPDSISGDDTVCMNSTNTYAVPSVNNANGYIWTIPTGWTIIGSSTGNSINVMAGSAGGTITAKAFNTCDSSAVVSFSIVVNPLPMPVIVGTGNVLNAGPYVSYQWLLNDTIVNGATSNPYTAVDTGNYQVIVTDANGCSDTSAIFHYATGVENIPGAEKIRMYPNPAVSVLSIDAPYAVDITIYSIDGRKVLGIQNAQQVDISTLSTGTYQVKITDREGRLVKMEKLVVIPK